MLPKPTSTTRVFIIDDHPVVRFGVEAALTQLPGYEIVGQASSTEEALPLIESTSPDLLTLDLLLDGQMESEFIPRIKALCPKMHILVFTMSDEGIFAERTLRAGASGYLMKSDGLTELKSAAQQILAGKIYVSNRLDAQLRTAAGSGKQEGALVRLSRRELEVFQRLGNGMTTSEIARELNLSVKTVATHRDNLKLKLNAATSIELVQKAVSCAFGQMK